MKLSRTFRFSLLAAALALAGATAAKEGPLDGMSKAWEEAFNKGDAEGVAAMYAEDGVVMPPNHARVQGRADIAAFVKQDYDAGFRLHITPADAWMDGKLAVRSGSYVVTDKDDKEVDHGKWVEAWRQGEDGKWWLVRDIWNSDDPLPVPPTPGVAGDKK